MSITTNSTLIAVALSTAVAGSVLADQVTIRSIVDSSGLIQPLTIPPALHNGRVAFMARDVAASADALFAVKAESGETTRIVRAGTTAPNSVADKIFTFTAPAFLDGRIAFAGGSLAGRPLGVYIESRSGIATLLDQAGVSGQIAPFSADTKFAAIPGTLITPLGGGTNFVRDGDPLPGGGVVADGGVGSPVCGGGIAVFPAVAKLPSESRDGLYAYDADTRRMLLVANWTSPTPRGAVSMFAGLATDGRRVGFTAVLGDPADRIHAVCVADALVPDVKVLAATGDAAPIAGMKYVKFGATAVRGDTVYFEAVLDHDGVASHGLFAVRPSEVTPVLVTGQMIGDRRVVDVRFGPHSADGHTLAAIVRTSESGSPRTTTELVLATIMPAPNCSADFTGDGRVGPEDLFRFLTLLFSGHSSADVDRSGAVDEKDVFAYMSLYFADCRG